MNLYKSEWILHITGGYDFIETNHIFDMGFSKGVILNNKECIDNEMNIDLDFFNKIALSLNTHTMRYKPKEFSKMFYLNIKCAIFIGNYDDASAIANYYGFYEILSINDYIIKSLLE